MDGQCANCGQPMISGHTISLDHDRRIWRLCCLCCGELVVKLDSVKTGELP